MWPRRQQWAPGRIVPRTRPRAGPTWGNYALLQPGWTVRALLSVAPSLV